MFELIDGKETLLRRAKAYFVSHYNVEIVNIRNRLIDKPYSGYPYLANFYSCTSYNDKKSVGLVRCARRIAKSLVYHKTNKCKFYSWWRVWNPKEYEYRMNEVTKGYRGAEVHKPSLTQKDFKNPFLLTYATFYKPNNKVHIHFFVLNMKEARRLVYFNKDRKGIVVDLESTMEKYSFNPDRPVEEPMEAVEAREDTVKVGQMVHELMEAKKELMDQVGDQYIKGTYTVSGGSYELTCTACDGITIGMLRPPKQCYRCGRYVEPPVGKKVGGEAEDDIPF